MTLAGYAHPNYAEVYREFGTPLRLASCGGSVLVRDISGTGLRDAMGCYPIFCCSDWGALETDFALMRGEYVSLVLVADPFYAPDEARLRALFDHVMPFKTHYVTELDQPIDAYVPKNRLREARKAMRKLTIEIISDPSTLVEDWLRLREEDLGSRLLTGINCLSASNLSRLFAIPGVVLLHAAHEGRTVGIHVEFHQGDVVFGHFAGYSRDGYRLGASTALHVYEIEHFRDKAKWIDWGGVPGASDVENGLSHFKSNFSSTQRTAFLCGRIFDRSAYEELSNRSGANSTSYFPIYRTGEFV